MTVNYVNDGTVTTASQSIEQDYTAYVDGGAAFTVNNGISYTLATPLINGATFQIGSTTSSSAPNSTLVLNAGTVIGTDTIKFDNAHATLVIGTNTLATIDIQSTDSASPTLVAKPNLGMPLIGHFGATLTNFQKGDTILVDTTVAAKFVEVSPISPVVDVVAINGGAVLGTLTFSSSASANIAVSNTNYLQDVVVTSGLLCFCADTLIATPQGQAKVQQLAAGDLVLTASGAARPIAWVGTGRVLATRGKRSAATPVIVRKNALADGVPFYDLRVTKGHAFHIDGVLVPVEFLVNHRTILWDDRAQEVSVYHIELDTHDVLLANGAPAESYRDDGNRWLFQNANEGWLLPPKPPCAPVLTGGPVVDAAWRRLLDRAGPRPAVPLTDDPDLHLMVGGSRVGPSERSGDDHVFWLEPAGQEVRVASRAAAPEEIGLARDPRCLGVALRSIRVRQAERSRQLAMDDASLAEGFHAFEPQPGIRWTDGDAPLPPALFAGFDGPLELILQLGGATAYIADSAVPAAA